MTSKSERPSDSRKRFDEAKSPKTVRLHTDFAGIRAGTVMDSGPPGVFASYIARIPSGETHTIERMRNELARRNDAAATCPVTTAIYHKVVAGVALDDLEKGKPLESVVPFWRLIEPGSKIARQRSCDDGMIAHFRALEATRDAGERPG